MTKTISLVLGAAGSCARSLSSVSAALAAGLPSSPAAPAAVWVPWSPAARAAGDAIDENSRSLWRRRWYCDTFGSPIFLLSWEIWRVDLAQGGGIRGEG